MSTPNEPDVINGLTPLEDSLAHVHPRLHFTQEEIEALRPKLGRAPWNQFLEQTRLVAPKSLVHSAFLYALTREPAWLENARQNIEGTLSGPGTAFGTLYALAVAYDWLYRDLDPALLARLRTHLDTHGRQAYEALAKHEIYEAGTYGWNIASDHYCNVAAAGAALYGDVPHVGPWMRLVLEKARLATDALGPDGVSAEGLCYGGFFTETYVKTIDLVDRLLGWSYFRGNEYLRHLPWFYLFSLLPRRHVAPARDGVHSRQSVVCFGDGVPYTWCGPDLFLRRVAAEFHDPLAQWVADLYHEAGASAFAGSYLSLLWYDPSIPARPPAPLPTFWHFRDKDMVYLRSGWDGDESLFAFHCGPHAGHHALHHYPQCIAGGHMAAGAGTFQLFAHGDWLISDGAYARKYTAYRNTVLVNGIGQTGQCDGERDWFECTDLRREQRGPYILRADPGEEVDSLIANVTPAYEKQAGLDRFLRHVVYVRPDTWILVDELETRQPAVFELYFHGWTPENGKAEHPFMPAGRFAWETGGTNGRCRLTVLLPEAIEATAEVQTIDLVSGHGQRPLDCLRVRNAVPARSALFVTVLEAYAAGTPPPAAPVFEQAGEAQAVRIATAKGVRRFFLHPGQPDPLVPVLQAESAGR